MQKLGEDKVQGILATSQLLSTLEKAMGCWVELCNEGMQHT
jgi:hypothetical protein